MATGCPAQLRTSRMRRRCCAALVERGRQRVPVRNWHSGSPLLLSRCRALRAFHDDKLGGGGGGGPSGPNPGRPGEEEDELAALRRFRSTGGGEVSNSSGTAGSSAGSEAAAAAAADAIKDALAHEGSSDVQDTLADLLQMEVRRIRVKEDLLADVEQRKQAMRAIGEELKESLARQFELERARADLGANFAMSEALQALDDVEKDVARIKQQLAADKADLAAWEERSAAERSRGLFFKSLYEPDTGKGGPRRPVGKSMPGYWRKQRELAAEAAAAAEGGVEGGVEGGSTWDAEAVAAAAERPLSAASAAVRSPLRLYLFTYLSAFLALLAVNDLVAPALTEGAASHAGPDALYAFLSFGLACVAARERHALGLAQAAMLEGIRRRGSGGGGGGGAKKEEGGRGGGGGPRRDGRKRRGH